MDSYSQVDKDYRLGGVPMSKCERYIPPHAREALAEEYIRAIGEDQPKKSALDSQVAGSHYTKLTIQPMEYSMANGLNACQHTAIKYITRYPDKGGIEDLRKSIHVIEMLIEFLQQPKETI